jgi:Beta-propeller repeat.
LASATATDGNGNVLVAGHGGYGPSIFLAKYSSSGAELWSESFVATGTPHAIALDANGNIFLTGEYNGTANFGGSSFSGNMSAGSMFVAKFSATGAHLWSRGFTSFAGPSIGRSVALDRSGNIVLTGCFASINFGGGVMTGSANGSLFVANLSAADGSYLWAKQFGTGQASGNGIAVDGNGNLFVTGYFASAINFGGGQLTTGSISTYGGFLVKLSASGTYVWSKGFGSFSSNPSSFGLGGNSVCLAPNGDVGISGSFLGSVDLGGGLLTANGSSVCDTFFARFSNSGTYLWSKHVTSSAASSGTSWGATSDGNGNMAFTGLVFGMANFGGVSTSTSGWSTFVSKYSPTGSCLWAKAYGGNNYGCGIAADRAGNLFTVGFWSGTVDFGSGPMSIPSGSEAFVLKLAP